MQSFGCSKNVSGQSRLARAALPVACALAVLGPLDAVAQSPASAAPADAPNTALEWHEVRKGRVAMRAKQLFYTNKWDLSGLPEYKPQRKVSGTLRVWGLNYIGDSGLADDWAEGFKKHHPDVTIEYNLPTALFAIPALITGLADIGASRPITFDERLVFHRAFDSDPVAIKMVTGAYDVPGYATTMAVLVHKDNPISKLNYRQLDGIFGAERTGGYQENTWTKAVARGPEGNIRTWGQLGLTGEWADKPITPHMATLRFHFPPVFERKVFGGGTKWNERLREYNNTIKPDGTQYSQGQQVVDEITRDRYAIGLSWISYVKPDGQVKAVAIAEKEDGPYAELTIGNVQNNTYPLAYHEYWYFHRKPGTDTDLRIKEYLRYTLSREGQEAVTRTGKFLPLTAAVVKEELRKLD